MRIAAENRADALAFFSRFLGAFFAVPPQKTGLFRGSALSRSGPALRAGLAALPRPLLSLARAEFGEFGAKPQTPKTKTPSVLVPLARAEAFGFRLPRSGIPAVRGSVMVICGGREYTPDG
jgi:hypothetical protein